MNRLLMICYHYPPANNGGVERSLKFVKYLPAYGWKPVVVTTSKNGPAPVVGQERVIYTRELFASLVRRMFKKPLSQHSSRRKTLSSKGVKGTVSTFWRASGNWIDERLFFPDTQVRWALPALWPSLRLLMRDEVDAIFTTSPPDSAHLLGLVLKKLTGKPWLMDLRDPWTVEPLNRLLQGRGLRRALAKRLESSCFACADKIILNTPEAFRRYVELYPGSACKMATIPNGFDAEEMDRARLAGSGTVPWREVESEDFLVSHVGAFARDSYQDNTPYAFLDALKSLLSRAGEEVRSLRVVFAGDLGSELKTTAYITTLGLDKVVDTPGTISHFDAMRLVWRSDLLVVFDPRPRGETYVHGKIYEYLGARKPILGILPDGASRDLLKRYGGALLAVPDDAAGIRRAFERVILEGEVPKINPSFDIAVYDRKRQSGELAACLENMVSKHPRKSQRASG
jgi:glycosyltransferase involved in cell wall biosynthesis